MNSQLHIQFYVNKDSPVPFSSHRVGHRITEGHGTPTFHSEMGWDMLEWMMRHPLGKVEFVWLDCSEKPIK